MVNHKKLFRVATLLFFIYLLSACSEFETLKSDVSAYYSFEADSIHESLANPNIPIDLLFIRESSITSKSTIFPQQGVTWNESEFLMVANAIHMHEWGEPLTEWIMFDQEHRFECSQTNLGAHYVSYSFFRVSDGERLVSMITVNARSNLVVTGTRIYSPVMQELSFIIENEIITAQSAVAIAEASGGTSERNKHADNCEIEVEYFRISDKRDFPEWKVIYVNQEDIQTPSFSVNAITGIVEP